MGEYGGVTAALATLVVSLTVAFGAAGGLPSLAHSKATALVTTAAKSKHISGAEARAAYAKAPYRKPVLRRLYAMAWVSAVSSHGKCHAQLLLGPDPKVAAAAAIRRSPKFLARLRASGRHREPGVDRTRPRDGRRLRLSDDARRQPIKEPDIQPTG